MADTFFPGNDPQIGNLMPQSGYDQSVPQNWNPNPEAQAIPTSTSRYGVRDVIDVQTFLTTEWVNYNGMNNMLLYASGVYGQVGKGAPYAGTNIMNTSPSVQDTILNIANGTINSSEFQANGELAATTKINPTVGELFIVSVMGAQGASVLANRPFQFTSVTVANQKRSSWGSFIGIGAMWIGDTPKKRAIWATGAVNNGNTFSGLAGFPFPTGAPRSPGGNPYTEQGNATPPLDPWDEAARGVVNGNLGGSGVQEQQGEDNRNRDSGNYGDDRS